MKNRIIQTIMLAVMGIALQAQTITQESGTPVKPNIPKNEIKISVGAGAQFASYGFPMTIASRGGLLELSTQGYSLSATYKHNLRQTSSLVYTCSYMTTFDFPNNGDDFSFFGGPIGLPIHLQKI